MSQSMTNGDKPSSQFLSHLTSYPVVSDGIDTFKTNPYGAKSIEVADSAYARFGKPFLPYLRTPYSYAAPYVAKADSLADAGLGSVDSHFPIVKEDTKTLYDTALQYASLPFTIAGQSKDYVLGTWQDEYSKTVNRNNRGPGLGSSLMAIISTEMKIASDALSVAAEYLGPKKEEAKNKGGAFMDQISREKDAYAAKAKDKKDQAASKTQDKTSN